MTPHAPAPRALGSRNDPLRDRRSTSAAVARLPAHREGARLMERRDSSSGVASMVDARARPGAIRVRDKLFFFSQLSVMLSAGVPVAVALDGIARQSDRLKLRAVLKEVLAEVEGGSALSAAMMRHPKVFEPTAVHLVRAGESCGDLPGMLERVCQLLARDYELRKKLKGAIMYPMVMLGLAVTTIVFLFTFILPRFKTLYAGKEQFLPRPTRMLLQLGEFVSAQWILLLIALVAGIVGLVFFLRTPRGKSVADIVMLSLPVLGGVIRKFSLARSVRSLGVLLQSGVPVLSAIELARDLAASERLKNAWEYVRRRVADGGRIHEGMAGQGWFPGTLVQMTAMGEAGGSLEAVLVRIGEFYDKEAETAVSEATALIEPAMVIIVGCVVGFIAMSIMLPIFNMSKLVKS